MNQINHCGPVSPHLDLSLKGMIETRLQTRLRSGEILLDYYITMLRHGCAHVHYIMQVPYHNGRENVTLVVNTMIKI